MPVATALAYGVWYHYAAQVYVGDLPPFDLPPFDLHFYTYDQALTYLAGLSQVAKASYLGPLHIAGFVLMICLTATLIIAVWRRGWFWAVPALGYLGCDVIENRDVASLLEFCMKAPGGELDRLPYVTGQKFVCLGVAAVLALWSLWRMRHVAG